MNVLQNERDRSTAAAGRPSRTPLVMAGCMLAAFLAMLDAQIVATALPRVVGDLGGLNLFAWVTTAYIIASSVTTPIYGKLGDLFGRKGVFMLSIGTFLVGSAASGLAQSMAELIVFRVVQGVGAGGLFVSVIAIIGELFSPREGSRYFGYFSVAFAVSALIGPAVGGVLTDSLGWRWVFYINLPVGVAALVLVGAFLRLPARPRRPHIDYAGFGLLSAAIVTVTLVTSWGGVRYGWGSPQIVALAVLAAALAALFVAAERRASEPVLPLRLFRDSTFTIATLTSVVAGFVFLGAVNFLVLYLQAVHLSSATMSGVILLPAMFGIVASSMISSRLISATGRHKWYPVASMALGVVSSVLLASMDARTSTLVAGAYMLLFGIAAGLNMQVLTMAAQNTAPREDLGAVSATVAFGRSLGASVGISVFAALFYGRLTAELDRRLPAGALGGVSRNSLSEAHVLGKLAAPVRQAVQQAYASALTPVFVAAIPVLAVGLVLTLAMRDVPLRTWNQQAAPADGQSTSEQG